MIWTNIKAKEAESISAHDGNGKIEFRRVFDANDSQAFNFLDYSVIPPHTSIGYHQHICTEEVYIIVKGSGLYTLNGVTKEVREGDVIAATDNDFHGLENNTNEEMEILVIEANVKHEK